MNFKLPLHFSKEHLMLEVIEITYLRYLIKENIGYRFLYLIKMKVVSGN
jgi:hypothetical protein